MKKSGFRQLIERIFLAPAATPGLQCVHQFNTVRRTQRLPATIGLEIHLGPAVHGNPGNWEEWISEVGIYSVCDSTAARIHTE